MSGVSAVLTVREYTEDQFVFFATRNGVVKKTSLVDFSRPRANGIIAIDLRVDDELINVALTDGSRDIMLISSNGRAMRFEEGAVRKMGRTAAGVRGIRMSAEDSLIALIVVEEGDILTATANGYGKRSSTEDYPAKGRGGKGVIDIKTSERNGPVVGAVQVNDDDEVMLITNTGTLIRTAVDGISTLGRNTQGVRLIRVSEGENLVQVERVATTDKVDDDSTPDDDNQGTEAESKAPADAESAEDAGPAEEKKDSDSGSDEGSDSEAGDPEDDNAG